MENHNFLSLGVLLLVETRRGLIVVVVVVVVVVVERDIFSACYLILTFELYFLRPDTIMKPKLLVTTYGGKRYGVTLYRILCATSFKRHWVAHVTCGV